MSRLETVERPVTPRDSLCDELLSVMREQERLCKKLCEISGAERRMVLDGRISELDRVTDSKNSLIDRMERLELRRRELSSQIAARCGLTEDAPLTSLAAKLETQKAKELLELGRRVSEVVAKLKESNETTLMLMRKSLDVVRDSLHHVRLSMGGGESYTPSGRPAVGLKNNLMVDCRA